MYETAFEYILQQRTNAAISSRSNLIKFSNLVSEMEKKRKGFTSPKDWHWKIIKTINANAISLVTPMTHPKKNYWGNKLAEFRSRLTVK